MYEPFASRVSRNPAIPDSTPSTLKNSRVSGITKEVGYVYVALSGFFVLFLEEKLMFRWLSVKLGCRMITNSE